MNMCTDQCEKFNEHLDGTEIMLKSVLNAIPETKTIVSLCLFCSAEWIFILMKVGLGGDSDDDDDDNDNYNNDLTKCQTFTK